MKNKKYRKYFSSIKGSWGNCSASDYYCNKYSSLSKKKSNY